MERVKKGRPMRHLALLISTVVVFAACSNPDEVVTADTTLTEAVTTTTAAPTTTTVPETTVPETTTSTAVPRPDSYETSRDYVVETVVSGLDAGTGGLAVDAEGNLYHADFGYPDHVGNTIFKVTPAGEISEFATSDLLASLTGNTFGPDGVLYQSSFGSNNVVIVDPDGTVTLLTDEVRGPTGIVVTDDGRVFVDSCRTNQVFEVFADGSAETLAGGVGMNCPNGLTIDDDGNLYVVNFNSGFMQRITPGGDIEAVYRFPSGNAHVVHVRGFLYVTARTDHRVYRYELATGDVVTVVGTGQEGVDDGPGNEATIARPNAIAVDPDGALYINHGGGDGRNDPVWIRKITPP
jgi:sugar lactone lactonase YvrE